MDKIYIVVAETMGTDGEYYSEPFPCKTSQSAYDCACDLIANMAETMYVEEDVNPETDWEIGNDDWWYRVRIEEYNL
jgi:hypothetical protein